VDALNGFFTVHGLRRCCAALLLVYAAMCAAGTARAEIVVDGSMDEAEWQDAVVRKDWQRTVPFALDAPRYHNELRLIATAQGLAAFFTIDQPASERRMKPRTPRDSETLTGDSVGLMVDFDATGQVGYEFSVGLGGGVRDGLITNQNEFDRDWDGAWQHAVRETPDQWFVEVLIPWSTVSMRGSSSERRMIGLYATRYLFERNERYSSPGLDQEAAVFLSDFERVEISQHQADAVLDFIPYGSLLSDQVADREKFKAGADINWKPSQNLSLAIALNPDFGQVESDELVVDFSAIETIYTDKRPFFTENQGIFDLRTPANGQLIYTRRIGAAPDEGSTGSSDIDAAVKLTGTTGSLTYGAFVAQEDDFGQDIGRRFAATRLSLPFDHVRIGHLATWAERPALDRDALVNAVDFEVSPSDWWRVSGQVVRSDIDQSSVRTNGYETWMQADFNRASPLTHTLKLLHIDRDFDMNDLGYMERSSLQQAEWETFRRVAADSNESRVSGETQRLYLAYRENLDGQRLQSRVQVSRDVQYRSAWRAYEELRYIPSGVDDVITRGNGPVRLDQRFGAYTDISSPRMGTWVYMLGGYLFQQGVKDFSGWVFVGASWYPHENLTVRLTLQPQYASDWLLWERGNVLTSYEARRLDFDFRIDWIPAARHELRVKWQWIGIDADPNQVYQANERGDLVPSEPIVSVLRGVALPDAQLTRPFTTSVLGLQVRYRFEMGPQSDLFVVYARGGAQMLNDDARDVGRLFTDMTDIRDADQVLIKVRYRL
jgi:hypothetical protein